MTNLQFEQIQAQDTVYALAYADNRCYAARASGLYTSEDNGQHWRPAYQKIDVAVQQPLVTTAVAAHGQDIFAGVKGGVLRSSNSGKDWFTVIFPPPSPLVSVLALSPNYEEAGHLVAGTAEDGVFVSIDRGLSWLPWNFGLLDLNIYAVAYSPDFATDQTIYIGTESGIFYSKNGGRAWRASLFPMDMAPVISIGFSTDSTQNHRLFAGTENHGLYVSDDKGTTWKQAIPNLVKKAVNAIVISPSSAHKMWLLLEDRLLASQDSGQTFQAASSIFLEDAQVITLLADHESEQSFLVSCADSTILSLP